jgi:hypothetical protein
MVRKFTAALIPPPVSNVEVTNGVLTITWRSIQNVTYRVQFKTSLTDGDWTDMPGDVTANGSTASKNDNVGGGARFYRVKAL